MASILKKDEKTTKAANMQAASALPVSTVQNTAQNLNQYVQAAQNAPSVQATQKIAANMPTYQQQAQQKQASPYTGLQGLSAGTSQQLGNLQQGYQQGAAVAAAQQQLQSVLDQKPQTYSGKYDAALESILQRITNPEQFKYSFNGDELFKSYADRYTQLGKQASLDAMGQAAALTGGYGNSYGQIAGQQQYDQYLQGLYDKGMDLYDRAWQRYQAGQDQLMDQYGVLSQADQTDYGRYRDTVGDWEKERDFWTGRADTEYDRDYGRYMDQLNYWTQMAGAENADYNTQQQMAEQKRQWDTQFEYNKMSDDRKYAYDQATAILANGKLPTDTLLKAAGISKTDAKRMMAQAKTGGGGGGSGKGKETYYELPDGTLYKQDDNGKATQVRLEDIPDTAKIQTGKKAYDQLWNGQRNYMGTVVSDVKKQQEEAKKKLTGKK